MKLLPKDKWLLKVILLLILTAIVINVITFLVWHVISYTLFSFGIGIFIGWLVITLIEGEDR